MTDTNPLFDQKEIEAGPVKMVLEPTSVPGRDVVYQVIISFPLSSLRIFCSKWANPLRCALEATEEALNELKCEIFNQELNAGKPYEKAGGSMPYPDMAGAIKLQRELNLLQSAKADAVKDEEKKDG